MSGRRQSPKFKIEQTQSFRSKRHNIPLQTPRISKKRKVNTVPKQKIQLSPIIARQQAKRRGIPVPDFVNIQNIKAGGINTDDSKQIKQRELASVTLLRFKDETRQINLPGGFDDVVFEILGNVGFSSSVLIEMLWLLRIHKNACLISSQFPISGRNRFDTITIDWVCIQDKSLAQFSFAFKTKDKIETRSNNRILKVPKGFQDNFMRCINNPHIRFIVIPIRFIHIKCQENLNVANAQAHANMVLYDKKTRTMERFEPWGLLDLYDNNDFDLEFSHWIMNAPENRQLPIEHYLGATEICPRNGFQFLQEQTGFGALSEKEEEKFFELLSANDGFFNKIEQSGSSPNMIVNFCTIWSNWYANLRMSNPSIAPARVIKESMILLRNDPRGMSSFILRYAAFVRSEAFNIFKEIGIDFNAKEDFLQQFDGSKKIEEIIEKIQKELEERISQT